jgi:cytochrome c556
MAQPTRLLWVFVVMLASAGPAAPQSLPAAQPAPVLDNVDLMDLMVKPAYDELRQAVAKPPSDRKAWAALYQGAARLAEIENLLFLRTRAGAERKAEWDSKAAAARQASADVAAAALRALRNTSATDFDDVTRRFPAVADGCNACHRAFAREAPMIKR